MLSSAASANEELTTALSAYEQGDFYLAHEIFTQLAEDHNQEAQYNLAFMYFGGDGVVQDDMKAAFWFEQAAKAGHAAAQDTLAYMYLNGRGRNVDRILAYVWYRLVPGELDPIRGPEEGFL